MKVVIFCHSLLSDWNHGNAHFLRGLATELARRGHGVVAFEPVDAWSVQNLVSEFGAQALIATHRFYPLLSVTRYSEAALDLDAALNGADLVIVHEWSNPKLVERIGIHRWRTGAYRLLFHDTHHRAVTAPQELDAYDLCHYDGVLAFGEILRDIYARRGWGRRAWTFHEAADTVVFRPHPELKKERDLVWIGNWGDDERTAELTEFIVEPVAALGISACVFGVRYPDEAKATLHAAGIEYSGWLPNYRVAKAFARSRVTVHVPRRPYVNALRGIPTIRPFEALACGIPLVSSPWEDREQLFTVGSDYLVARSGDEMTRHLRHLIQDEDYAQELARHGRATILARHTCGHRVDELLSICQSLGLGDENRPLAASQMQEAL